MGGSTGSCSKASSEREAVIALLERIATSIERANERAAEHHRRWQSERDELKPTVDD
jgi:hypothetical protein